MANPIPGLRYIYSSLVPQIQPIFRVRSPDPFLALFTIFFVQTATEYYGAPIPMVAEYSQLGGIADSDDFQGPIARPVSDDFRHFFTQIVVGKFLTIVSKN